MTGKTKAWLGGLGELITENNVSNYTGSSDDWVLLDTQSATSTLNSKSIGNESSTSVYTIDNISRSDYMMKKIVITISGNAKSGSSNRTAQYLIRYDFDSSEVIGYGDPAILYTLSAGHALQNISASHTYYCFGLYSSNAIKLSLYVYAPDGAITFTHDINMIVKIYGKITW